MSFDLILATYPPIHKVQFYQPSYSAQDLGIPITIGEKLNFTFNFNRSLVYLVTPSIFNSATLFEENFSNSETSFKFNKIDLNYQIHQKSSHRYSLVSGVYEIQNSELNYKPISSEFLDVEVSDPYIRTWKKEFEIGKSFLKNNFNSKLKRLSNEETSSIYTSRGTKNLKYCGRDLLLTFMNPAKLERSNFNAASLNPTQSSINLIEPVQFNLETLSEENSPNSEISVKLKEIEAKFGQINSVSTDIKVGAVKSELDLDSQDLETELTLLSQSGFKLKMKKEFHNKDRELTIGPVVNFKKSFDLFEQQSEIEPDDKKIDSRQASKLAIIRRLTQDLTYSNSLIIDGENEIDNSSKEMKDLEKSLNSLETSQLTNSSSEFSLEGDLEDFSAEFEFPVPGSLRDELELKIKTNVPEVLLDGEVLPDNVKSTLSLRYGIAIDDAAELEIESSYNLRTSQTTHEIVFELL